MNVANIVAMAKLMSQDLQLPLQEKGKESFLTHLGQHSENSSFLTKPLTESLSELTDEENIMSLVAEELLLEDLDEEDLKLISDKDLSELLDEGLPTDETKKEGNGLSDGEGENSGLNQLNELIFPWLNEAKDKDKYLLFNRLNHNDRLRNVGEAAQSIALNRYVNPIQVDVEVIENNDVTTQVEQLIFNAGTLLEEIDATNVKQISVQLLGVLRNLSQFMNDGSEMDLSRLFNERLPENESKLVKGLLNLFQNRNNLALAGAYRHEAEVTSEDIAKWLTQAMDNQTIEVKQPTVIPIRSYSEYAPMSQVEQYVIHISESDRVERVQEQLVRQFESVMKQSRFLKAPELTQLSFTLNPSNLGSVHVQLVEVNGEMTVKMLASSLAAKRLLESNIHQLKHMFAPHNVVVERNDTEIEEIDQLDEHLDEEEQAMSEEENKQGHESDQEDNEALVDNFQSVLENVNTQLGGEEINDD